MAMACIRSAAGLLLAFSASASAAERINQEGRILGPAPTTIAAPLLFNTPQADAVLSAMQIFPTTNAWNEDVSARPLLTNSSAMIARIRADCLAQGAGRNTLRAFSEMNFVLVPNGQTDVPITFTGYPAESDPSPYPIPANMPIETWPVASPTGLTLQQWQQDVNGTGGDRHSIVVKPVAGVIWETWQAKLVSGAWQASNGAKFDLGSNALRTAGWTSGDAAGLPMLPALVRYDECERGMVEHAMRVVVAVSRNQYVYPATHFASSSTDVNLPMMGQRVRLKTSFAIPATWTKQEKAVLLGLKKYGALVADNGGFFSISVTPDERYPSGCFNHLSTVDISNFEVVQGTGATQGPRSAGAPTVNAGSDHTITIGLPASLAAAVTGTGVTVSWYLNPNAAAPGTVTFANAAAATTTATFSAAGSYTLMAKVSDGVHAPAYDAIIVTVSPGGTSTSGGSTGGSTGRSTGGTSSSGGGTTGSNDSGGGGGCGHGFSSAALAALIGAWLRRVRS
jgi:hypothetical protein